MAFRGWLFYGFAVVFIQVYLTTQAVYGCSAGSRACLRYFVSKESSVGTGMEICELASDSLDCLEMARPSCGPGESAPVDGPIYDIMQEYGSENYSCNFDNVGKTPGYGMYQCTKLFGDCKDYVFDSTCGVIRKYYEMCLHGISTFCTTENLRNVTDIINSEKERLVAEQGCVFDTSVGLVPLSGEDCLMRFTACFQGHGITATKHPCVVAPVYQTCRQTDVTGVCDSMTAPHVDQQVNIKQMECNTATTTEMSTSTTTTPTTTTSQIPSSYLEDATTVTSPTKSTTPPATDTSTWSPVSYVSSHGATAFGIVTALSSISVQSGSGKTSVDTLSASTNFMTSVSKRTFLTSATSPTASTDSTLPSGATSDVSTAVQFPSVENQISTVTTSTEQRSSTDLVVEPTLTKTLSTQRSTSVSQSFSTAMGSAPTSGTSDTTITSRATSSENSITTGSVIMGKATTILQNGLETKGRTELLSTEMTITSSKSGAQTTAFTTKPFLDPDSSTDVETFTQSDTSSFTTKSSIKVTEMGPGQIYLYYDSGSILRCQTIVLLLGVSSALASRIYLGA